MNENNWVSRLMPTENDKKLLEKAHRNEKDLISKGYRWHTINPRCKFLIPYENGKPTKQGLEMIETFNNR